MHFIYGILFALVTASPSRPNKQYRKDYVYNSKTDAFYKLHTEWATYIRATFICDTEGAQLMVPKSTDDIVQLHGMLKQFTDIGDMVFVGSDGGEHDSAEEQPMIKLEDLDAPLPRPSGHTCEVITNKETLKSVYCFSQLPFICKVEAKNAPYNPNCDVYSRGYEYYPRTGSCYKISRNAVTWNEAYAQCTADDAHLAILNSLAEQQVIYNISNAAPPAQGSVQPWFIYVGVRARKTTGDGPRIFKTVLNQTLQEAGFDTWAPGEPNNALQNEYCGSIFKNEGTYNDVDCSHNYGYICEKEMQKPNRV